VAATASRRSAGFFDFLTMGRNLTLPVFAFSLAGVWYGGIFGNTADYYGLSFADFLLRRAPVYATYVGFALIVLPRLRRFDQSTLPEVFARATSPAFGRLVAVLAVVAILPLPLSASLGVLMESAFGISATSAAVILLLVIAGYSMVGGCRAVLMNDILSCLLATISIAAVVAISWQRFGGVDYLVAHLPPAQSSPLPGYSVLLVAVAIFGNPMLIHRSFLAEGSKTATKGFLVATAIWVFFDVLLLVGVQYAQAALPTVAPAAAFFSYALQVLPAGIKGFFLATVLVGLLATIDSYVFLAGAMFANDVTPTRATLTRARLAVAGAALLCALFGPTLSGVWANVALTLGAALGSLLLAAAFGLFQK
jgi:SSS family solute:Na+ symporter